MHISSFKICGYFFKILIFKQMHDLFYLYFNHSTR